MRTAEIALVFMGGIVKPPPHRRNSRLPRTPFYPVARWRGSEAPAVPVRTAHVGVGIRAVGEAQGRRIPFEPGVEPLGDVAEETRFRQGTRIGEIGARLFSAPNGPEPAGL